MSQTMRGLAASIFERELALSLPIVPKGQEPKEAGMYDVYYLSENKRAWIRYALWRTLTGARQVAQAMSQHEVATWIRPHAAGDSVLPTGAA